MCIFMLYSEAFVKQTAGAVGTPIQIRPNFEVAEVAGALCGECFWATEPW
jgi:hypothetical protein